MGIKILSLSKNEDFKKILSGRKINNYYSTIFFKKLSHKNNNSLNLSIITKRKLGKAVQRNKIKRRLKNIINYILKSIKINLSIITKRKLGKAVQRNKIKRRLKNIINYILKSIKINLKYSYLIIAKKNVLDSKYSEIKETILVDFKKIL